MALHNELSLPSETPADPFDSVSTTTDALTTTQHALSSLQSVLVALRTAPELRTEQEADTIYNVFAQTAWFSSIPALTGRQMALQATIAEFDSKTEIEKEGSLSSVFYVVLFGSMSVYRRAGNKKRRYISTIGRGATIGEPSLLLSSTSTSSHASSSTGSEECVRSGSTVISEMPSVAICVDRRKLTGGRAAAIRALHREPKERSAEDIAAVLQCIKAMSFFRQLTPEAQSYLASTVGITKAQEGDAICRQGEKGNTMYVLLSGSITVEMMVDDNDSASGNEIGRGGDTGAFLLDGKTRRRRRSANRIASNRVSVNQTRQSRRTVGHLGAGDSFGELALIESSNRRNATCIVESESAELITISKPVFESVLNNNDAIVYKPEQARNALSVLPGERTERDVVMIMDMVKKHRYFCDLEDEVKSILAKVMTLEVVETGQVVYEQETRGECLYVILSGECGEYRVGGNASAGQGDGKGGTSQGGLGVQAGNAVSTIAAVSGSPIPSSGRRHSSGSDISQSKSKFKNTTKHIISKMRHDIHGMNTHIANKMKKDAMAMRTLRGGEGGSSPSGKGGLGERGRGGRRASIAEEIGMQINATEQKAKHVLDMLVRRRSSIIGVGSSTGTTLRSTYLRHSFNVSNTLTNQDDDSAESGSSMNNNSPLGNGRGVMSKESTFHRNSFLRSLHKVESKYGELVATFYQGDSFGEHALQDPSSKRSGTVVAENRAELLVIQRYTYDRFITHTNNEAWSEHVAFLSSVPVLHHLKRSELLNLLYYLTPLTKERKGEMVLKEKAPVNAIYFVRHGAVTLTTKSESNTRTALRSKGDLEDNNGSKRKFYDNSNSSLSSDMDSDSDEDDNFGHDEEMNTRRSQQSSNSHSNSLQLVSLGPGEFFGEESITTGVSTTGVVVSQSPLSVFVLGMKDLARMPQSVRENILTTAKLRRKWRRSRLQSVGRSGTLGNDYGNGSGSAVCEYYKDGREEITTRFAMTMNNRMSPLHFEMNVDKDEAIKKQNDSHSNGKDSLKVTGANEEDENAVSMRSKVFDEGKDLFTSSLLTDVVHNSWTFRLLQEKKRTGQSSRKLPVRPATAGSAKTSSRMFMSDSSNAFGDDQLSMMRRQKQLRYHQRPKSSTAAISESGFTAGQMILEEYDTQEDNDMYQIDNTFQAESGETSNLSTNQDRPLTAGASRASSAIHLNYLPSYGIPTSAKAAQGIGKSFIAKTTNRKPIVRPRTAIGYLGGEFSTTSSTKKNYYGNRDQIPSYNQRSNINIETNEAVTNIRDNDNTQKSNNRLLRPQTAGPTLTSSDSKIEYDDTIVYNGSSPVGRGVEVKKGLYTQRQQKVCITNISATGRLFL